MKHTYWLDFGCANAILTCGLCFDRVGKTPLMRVKRTHGDLPFYRYFLMMFLSRVGRYLVWRSNVIDYEIRVTAGIEDDIVWKLRADKLYEPHDDLCDVSMPHLARKIPPGRTT